MSLSQGTDSFLRANRVYLLAGAVFFFGVIFYVWNPFQEQPLQTEYHSGRDSFTVAPNQIPKPPVFEEGAQDNAQPLKHSQTAATDPNTTPSVTTPQTAAIEAQLAEAKKLSSGSEARAQRITELNQLIAKVDAAQGIQRKAGKADAEALTHPRTAQIAQELNALQERTERLQKRLN
jgi:hypothetical protein